LQRAYDQIIHDVALQKLPVRFAIDRAGFVGADGPTHAGSFDLAYLVNIPNFVVMAPSNGQELVKMINTAQNIDYCPSAFRFPRAEANCDIDFNDNEILEIGKAKILQNGSKVAVMALGTILENVIEADKILKQQHNLEITIVDARFAKPFDEELVLNLVKTHQLFITIEEGVIGGFGSLVGNFLHNSSFLDEGKCKFRSLFMKDEFIEQDDIAKMRIKGDLGVDFIVDLIAKSL
jgi:1-deoxy-D-xylulose-5-phosphate synthase